ncbi:MAG: GAF domain-containing protein [Bacteroidetes bacterium]|nr:MAG: GAF domain-containing protein [Bacteroidota bacterium]
MIAPPIPKNEHERLSNLRSYCILDTEPEEDYDNLTTLTAELLQAPICVISLIDKDRQWFKSKVGLDAPETPRDISFCGHAINSPQELMIIKNANKDPRFCDNPLVSGDPHVVFYAGAPLISSEGYPFGTLCVIDYKERTLSDLQKNQLTILAQQVSKLFQLRKRNLELTDHLHEKEILMKEMHHRVKNNLQIISSLLSLQMDSFDDEKAINALCSSRDRIIAMSLVHQQLYQNNGVTQVELKKFLSELLLNLGRVYSNIEMKVKSPKLMIELDTAVPLSLIVSELITNSCKHGFSEHQHGSILVSASMDHDHLYLTISDNGKGFSSQEKWNKPNSLGFEIIQTLTEQLNGNIECESSGKGTKFSLAIPTNDQLADIKQTA